MERRRSGNVWVTAAIGSVAVALACGAFLVKYLRGGVKAKKSLESTPAVEERATPFCRTHHAQVALSHTTALSATLSEWSDLQLGMRISFCPQTLALIHEERQRPIGMLKFVSCKETETTVQCIFEEIPAGVSAESYRRMSIDKICDVCQLISVDGWERFGSEAHPLAKYCYLCEADSIVNVLSVFLAHDSVALTIQFCSSKALPNTLPIFVHELVRNVKFVAPQPSTSYLFCCEPRLGVGFRLPLGFVLDNDDPHGKLFAALHNETLSTRVVAFHKEMDQQVEWSKSFEDILTDCSLHFGFRKPNESEAVRTFACEVPLNNARFGFSSAENDASRTIQGYCCFQEVCPIHASATHSTQSTSEKTSYLCAYVLPIDNECVVLAFLCSRKHDKQQFIHFCQSVANSLSLGNHYGQETSLSYCCMRGLHKFHLSIGTAFSVREGSFGDPLCELYSRGARVTIRIVPPVARHETEAALLSWVKSLPGEVRVCSVFQRSLTSVEGSALIIIHQHNVAALDENDVMGFDQNPLAIELDEREASLQTITVASALVNWGHECFVLRCSSSDEGLLATAICEVAQRMVPLRYFF